MSQVTYVNLVPRGNETLLWKCFKGNAISDIQLWIICVISTNDGQDVMGGWRNDQEGLKARGVQPALASRNKA